MYEVIVDGESLKDLIFITDVERTMGPFVKNRIVTIHAYILHDILATVDVLNKLLTGKMQEFIFTDQPDRYWKGKVKEDIKVSSSYERTKIDIDIEIPDGVSHAINPKELSFSGRTSLILENDGSDYAYPTFDFKLKEDTYMVSAVSRDKVFQFGEPLEASPMKQVRIQKEGLVDGYETRRSWVEIDSRFNKLNPTNYDASKIHTRWHSAGDLVQRNKSMPTPSNGKIKVGKWATHWQTGERIDNWVKGRSFPVAQTKTVRQSKSSKAYLLKNNGVYIGWLLEQDIDGPTSKGFACNNGNSHDMLANFASGQSGWHGPCKSYPINLDCTDFELEAYLNYFVGPANQFGAMYIGVYAEDIPIMAASFSTHYTNRITSIYYDVYDRCYGKINSGLASNFWGKISMKKHGEKFSFSTFNDMSKKSYTKDYNLTNKELKPTHILVWAGKYGSNPQLSELSFVRLKFTGLDGKLWTDKDVTNIPDPRYKFSAGDVVRLEMETNKAYVNGIETLSPISYGSDTVKLKPGKNEIMFDISSDVLPDIDVFYRERFK